MAGGEAGVDRAIEILSEQVTRTMKLLGVTSSGGTVPAARDPAAPASPWRVSSNGSHLYSFPQVTAIARSRVRAESQSLANRDVTDAVLAPESTTSRDSLRTESNGNCLVTRDERWVGCRYEVRREVSR